MVLRPILDLIDTLDVILKMMNFHDFRFFELWVLTLIRPNIEYPAEYRPIDVIFQEST